MGLQCILALMIAEAASFYCSILKYSVSLYDMFIGIM